MKLKGVVFQSGIREVLWITLALQTITSEHRDFQQISIKFPHQLHPIATRDSVKQRVGEVAFGQWMDLDWLLIQFWESREIRPKIMYPVAMGKGVARAYAGALLPEVTERGIIEFHGIL